MTTLSSRPLLRGIILLAMLWVVSPLSPAEPTDVRFQAPRIIAFGDVHGAFDQLFRLLRDLDVIDDSGSWTAGSTHLVSLGDLLDRGADSKKVMDLLMKLQSEAPAAGGQVHVVLGNHELMNLTGDLRYVSKGEYAAFAEPGAAADVPEAGGDQPPPGFEAHREAFLPNGAYGQWLLQQPSVLVVNDTAFVHGGLPPLAATASPADMEATFKARLNELLQLRVVLEQAALISPNVDVSDSAKQLQARLDAEPSSTKLEPIPPALVADAKRFAALAKDDLFSDAGVLWYRGTARCHHLLEAPVLADALSNWQVSRVVMGHTPTPDHRIRQRFDGQAILADTGMLTEYYRGQPAGLIIAGSSARVFYPDTAELADRPDPMPAIEISGLDAETIGPLLASGVMAPAADAPRADGALPVSVAMGDTTVLGLFQRGGKRDINNQLAAYQLDRLLNLGLVAPVVAREYEGKRGTLTAIWTQTIDEAERTALGQGPSNWCGRGNIFSLMYVLDALIQNQSRQPTTMLYNRGTWQFMSTGHAKAFGRGKGFPAYLQNAPAVLPLAFAEALRALDEPQLEEHLGDLLSRNQRRDLLKRRDELLKTWKIEG